MGIEDVILEAVREEGREEGIEKGKKENTLEMVLRMKKAGFSTADIAKATGLTKEQVEKL